MRFDYFFLWGVGEIALQVMEQIAAANINGSDVNWMNFCIEDDVYSFMYADLVIGQKNGTLGAQNGG